MSDRDTAEYVHVPRDDFYSNQRSYDAEDEQWYTLTWKEVARQREDEIARLRKWATICVDLDRCEHGRHEGDICAGCGGPSHGNRLIGHAPIGHTMDAHHIFVPSREHRHDPSEWFVKGPCRDPEQAGTPCPINLTSNGSYPPSPPSITTNNTNNQKER